MTYFDRAAALAEIREVIKPFMNNLYAMAEKVDAEHREQERLEEQRKHDEREAYFEMRRKREGR